MELSELEQKRLENIRRNEAVLQSLGFNQPSSSSTDLPSSKSQRVKRERKQSDENGDDEDYEPPVAIRRSSRLDPKNKPGAIDTLRSYPLDEELLQRLLEQGFEEIPARKSLLNTNASLEDALDWLKLYENDPALDDPTKLLQFVTDTTSSTSTSKRARTTATPTSSSSSSRSAAAITITADNEETDRHPISSNELRAFIDQCNPFHSEMISDKAIVHCTSRIHTMNNDSLGKRIRAISTYVYLSFTMHIHTIYACIVCECNI